MHNRQGLTWKLMYDAFMDYDLWPLYVISLTLLMPTNPPQAYLTLNLRSLGFGTFETNLLIIPVYALFLAQLIFWTWASEKINNRMSIVLFYSFWCLPLLLALEFLPSTASPWTWYAISGLLIAFPYVHSINGKWLPQFRSSTGSELILCRIVSLTSRNAGSVRTRTVGSALYNMICQASAVISSNVCSFPIQRALGRH